MKILKQSTWLLAVLLFALTSCKKDVVSETENKSITADASLNSAFTFNDQTDIDLTLPRYYEINSCTGEHLHITSGTWHIDVHGVINNNKVSFDKHTNTLNYKLVSLITGIEYTGSYASSSKYNATFYNGLFTFTQTLSILLTTAGGGNNSELKMDEHVTIDANGNLTSWVDNFRSGCQ